MELMTEEKEIIKVNNNEITLTTHRIRFQRKIGGNSNITSIMLEELSSCDIIHRSNTSLLIVGILVFLTSVVIGFSYTYGFAGILLALIILIAYLYGRKGTISLASPGTTIKFASGMRLEEMTHFIDEVESAKNQRYLMLIK